MLRISWLLAVLLVGSLTFIPYARGQTTEPPRSIEYEDTTDDGEDLATALPFDDPVPAPPVAQPEPPPAPQPAARP